MVVDISTNLSNAGIIALSGVFALVFALLTVFHVTTRKPGVKGVPFPKPDPIFGHLLEINRRKHEKHTFLLEKFESLNSDVFSVSLPTPFPWLALGCICTRDPVHIEHIVKTEFSKYDKGFIFTDNFRSFLGDGIFAVDGEKWKTQRKLASHIFTINNFKNLFINVFEEQTQKLAKLLSEHSRCGDTFDLQQLFYAFTLDSFGHIAFGVDFACLDTTQQTLPFATSFDKVQAIVADRFINPFWFISEHFTGARSMLNKNLEIMDQAVFKLIKDTREQKKNNTKKQNQNLLDFFMDYKTDDGRELNERQLRDIVLNFILAGRDTTAAALSWTFFLLSNHPRVQLKLKEEATRVLGQRIATHDDLKHLKYAHAVFYEVLRLYPPVAANIKLTNAPDTLPDGVYLPKNTLIFISSYAAGRSSKIWGPDAYEFKPERWLTDEGDLKKESQYKWPVFHAGPRVCLGQGLATHEAVAVITFLVRKFEISLEQQQSVTYGDSIILPIKNGLKVTVKNA